MDWRQFLKLHWEVLAATDFFTVEVATWRGLVTYYILIVMELATRRVQIAGITPHPTDAFVQQCAWQLTDPFDGFLLGKRYLLHDRDTKFTGAFDMLLKDGGVEPLQLPPQGSLHSVLSQYLVHYHQERNHQGLSNRLIGTEPDWSRPRGPIRRRERLGGLLSYYYREAA
jgi:hypothetical protein